MLTGENMLGFSAVSIAEICLVDMTVVQPKALLGEPNGSCEYERHARSGKRIW